MKKMALFSALMLGLAFIANQGNAFAGSERLELPELDSALQIQLLAPQNVIDWKVGETAEYNVLAGAFGNLGKLTKSVTKDEGTALWVHQEVKLQGQQQIVDILLSKADAKILKYIVNGKEEAVPNDPIEVISQDFVEVKVPAGTFQAIHVVAKSEKIKKIEIWANPRDTVMDGTIKQYVESGFLPLTTELTSFKRGQ